MEDVFIAFLELPVDANVRRAVIVVSVVKVRINRRRALGFLLQ